MNSRRARSIIGAVCHICWRAKPPGSSRRAVFFSIRERRTTSCTRLSSTCSVCPLPVSVKRTFQAPSLAWSNQDNVEASTLVARCLCVLVLTGCGEPTNHAPDGSSTPTDDASTTASGTGTTGAAGVGTSGAAGPMSSDSGALGGVSNSTTGQGGVTGTGSTSSTHGGSGGTSITSAGGGAGAGSTLVTASATGAGGTGATGGAGGTGNTVIDPGPEGDGRFELSAPYDPVNMDVRNGPRGSV